MTDERIIAYLLEELPGGEMEQFEEECFTGKDWPAQINHVEEDLIEAYLRKELTPQRRQRFEQNYLTTEARQERVVMVAALLRCVDEHSKTSKPAITVPPSEPAWAERLSAFWGSQSLALRVAAGIIIVALTAGVLWLFMRRTPGFRPVATLTLTISNSDRAGGAQAGQVHLPADAEALKISLIFPQPPPVAARYRVTLEDINGGQKSVEITETDAASILVKIPAAQLAPGQYAVKLFAVQSDGTEKRINGAYFFDVN